MWQFDYTGIKKTQCKKAPSLLLTYLHVIIVAQHTVGIEVPEVVVVGTSIIVVELVTTPAWMALV